jgi:hypothetical protein
MAANSHSVLNITAAMHPWVQRRWRHMHVCLRCIQFREHARLKLRRAIAWGGVFSSEDTQNPQCGGARRCLQFREQAKLVVRWLRAKRACETPSCNGVRRFSQFREHAEFRAMARDGALSLENTRCSSCDG